MKANWYSKCLDLNESYPVHLQVLLGEGYYAERTSKQTIKILKRRGKDLESQIETPNAIIKDLKFEASFFDETAIEAAVSPFSLQKCQLDSRHDPTIAWMMNQILEMHSYWRVGMLACKFLIDDSKHFKEWGKKDGRVKYYTAGSSLQLWTLSFTWTKFNTLHIFRVVDVYHKLVAQLFGWLLSNKSRHTTNETKKKCSIEVLKKETPVNYHFRNWKQKLVKRSE